MFVLDFNAIPPIDHLDIPSEYLNTIQDLIHGNSITIYSSGSTGTPKPFTFTYQQICTSALKTNNYFQITSSSHLVLPLHPRFVASKLMIARAYLAKAKLFIIEPKRELDFTGIPSIDLIAISPFQYIHSISGLATCQIKYLLIGGGSATNCNFSALSKQTKVYESYGMTETLTHIALRELSPTVHSAFTPLDGIHLSTNSQSEAIIDYPELTTDPIHTTDIIELNRSGDFIWKGRSDFTINSGGIKIQPEVVEQMVSTRFSLNTMAVAIPDEVMGEKLSLAIEGTGTIDLNSILWPKYHKPKSVYHLDRFVYNSNGKVNRLKTRQKLIDQLF